MPVNIPEVSSPRVVIVGAGFAGLTLARKLARSNYQVVLLDKNNFHQFQPLFYQVAMAGLEPSAISFPLRKIFRRRENVFIRMCKVESVDIEKRQLQTDLGIVNYDILALSMGVTTNFFGNDQLDGRVFTLKSVSESLFLRNAILTDLERALTVRDYEPRQGYLDIVIVGGGPTGVELAGALAEMRKNVLPREYQEIDAAEMDIHLIQGGPRLLMGMSEESSAKAEEFLAKMGVMVQTGVLVKDYIDGTAILSNGTEIPAFKVIWAAGIKGRRIAGIPESCYTRGDRLEVDKHHKLKGVNAVYVLGDQAFMSTDHYESGHPQVAQGAIQHASNLAGNLIRIAKGKEPKDFKYKDLGTLATIGRNKAVADLPRFKTQGFIAWLLWLVVHLKSLLGVKNKLFVLVNWVWDYITYDPGLRIVIRHKSYQKKL